MTTIDDLPEGIIFHIFSFLLTFDAIRASAVSQKWRNLWHSLPTLNFNIKPFHYRIQNHHTIIEIRQLFAEFVTQTLFLRQPTSSPIRKFKLKFDYGINERHKFHLGSWVQYAIKCNAVELHISIDSFISNTEYYTSNPIEDEALDRDESEDYMNYQAWKFHFADLIYSSVQVLKLCSCELSFPTNASIRIASLKSISLIRGYCCIITSEEVSNMLSLCVSLEYLSIDCNDDRFENLKIVSPSLKYLVLSNHTDGYGAEENSIEIRAPSLVSMRFDSYFVGKYILKDISSLVAAHLDFDSSSHWEFACWSKLMISLTGVERLSTSNMWMWFEFEEAEDSSMHDNDEKLKKQSAFQIKHDDTLEKIYGQVSVADDVFSENFVFSNLTHLELKTGYTKYELLGLEYLLEICPKLEFLVLKNYSSVHSDGDLAEEMKHTPIVFDIPCLREVKMKNYRRTKRELFVVGLLKKNKVVLENIVAFPARSRPPKPDEACLSPFVL